MTWEFWLLIGVDFVFVIAVFAGRNWLKATIERRVQHRFDTKIEEVRTELRKSEEIFKSELRSKETEIGALRDGILSGRTQRQAFLDKRRLDAVERLWAGFVALAPYRGISASMANINFEAAARNAPSDPKIRQLFEIISSAGTSDPGALYNNTAKNERPFVSPLAWAYFFAYLTILSSAFAHAKMLELGVENPGNLFAKTAIRELLKAALPHRSEFIDKHDPLAFDHLLGELETNLLGELQKILRGEDQDAAGVAQAARIMEMIGNISKEPAQEKAVAVAPASVG